MQPSDTGTTAFQSSAGKQFGCALKSPVMQLLFSRIGLSLRRVGLAFGNDGAPERKDESDDAPHDQCRSPYDVRWRVPACKGAPPVPRGESNREDCDNNGANRCEKPTPTVTGHLFVAMACRAASCSFWVQRALKKSMSPLAALACTTAQRSMERHGLPRTVHGVHGTLPFGRPGTPSATMARITPAAVESESTRSLAV